MNKNIKTQFNILAIGCIIIFVFSLVPKTLQNDTYYTISIGEHIMQNGIDNVDPFSWHDLKYTYPHWLYDVCTYLVYSAGGMTGIYISTIILSVILGIMMYVTNKKVNQNHLFSFIFTIGGLFLIQDYIAARAQLVTFNLFVIEILLIECFLETKKKRYAFRTYANSIFNCKLTCSSILFLFHTYVAIYWRIFNSNNKRFRLSI